MTRGRSLDRTSRLIVSGVGAGALVFWEVGVRAADAGAALPPPTSILAAVVHQAPLVVTSAAVSTWEALAGLTLALAGAFISASGVAVSRRANAGLMPLILASQTVPLLAIAPLLVTIIGEEAGAKILLTAWLCWFPAMISFAHGLSKVHPDRLLLFRASGATRWQTYRHLRLPGAASAITAGVRASAGFALIGAIVVEYGSADVGLGALIIQHVSGARPLSPDVLWGLVVVSSLLGLALTWGAHALARLALRRYLVSDA